MTLGNDELSVLHQLAQLQPPLGFQAGRNIHARKIVAEHIISRLSEADIGLLQTCPIDPYLLIHQAQPVTRHADYPFDEMLRRVNRIVKHNNVATTDLPVRHYVVRRATTAVSELIHQQVIAGEERVFHRLGGNLESLHNKRDHKYGDHHCSQQRLQRSHEVRVPRPWLFLAREIHQLHFSTVRDALAAGAPPAFEWEAR